MVNKYQELSKKSRKTKQIVSDDIENIATIIPCLLNIPFRVKNAVPSYFLGNFWVN